MSYSVWMKIDFLLRSQCNYILENRNNIGDSIYIVMQDKDGDEWILTNKGATIVGKKSMANLMPFKFMVENADDIYLATSKAFCPI